MSKGNLFLGFGRGKVGDVVFSRVDGEQVARARNRSPRNPQTALQLLQRVVMKTTSSAFSLMQEITNHSFQGFDGVTMNQSQFTKLNVEKFRAQLAEIINAGEAEYIVASTESNFSPKGVNLVSINPYVVSSGTIGRIPCGFLSDGTPNNAYLCFTTVPFTIDTTTYQDVITALGLRRGDQLTILCLTCDDTSEGASSYFNAFKYSRFILEPSDGDLSHLINDRSFWNVKNKDVDISQIPTSAGSVMSIMPADVNPTNGTPDSLVAGTIIVSRLSGDVWQRSDAELVLRPWTVGTSWHLVQDHGENLLGDAIQSFMVVQNSGLYLNQADFL